MQQLSTSAELENYAAEEQRRLQEAQKPSSHAVSVAASNDSAGYEPPTEETYTSLDLQGDEQDASPETLAGEDGEILGVPAKGSEAVAAAVDTNAPVLPAEQDASGREPDGTSPVPVSGSVAAASPVPSHAGRQLPSLPGEDSAPPVAPRPVPGAQSPLLLVETDDDDMVVVGSPGKVSLRGSSAPFFFVAL